MMRCIKNPTFSLWNFKNTSPLLNVVTFWMIFTEPSQRKTFLLMRLISFYGSIWKNENCFKQMEAVTLNETTLQSLPETKRPIFVYEWLRRLDRILSTLADSNELNEAKFFSIYWQCFLIQRSIILLHTLVDFKGLLNYTVYHNKTCMTQEKAENFRLNATKCYVSVIF